MLARRATRQNANIKPSRRRIALDLLGVHQKEGAHFLRLDTVGKTEALDGEGIFEKKQSFDSRNFSNTLLLPDLQAPWYAEEGVLLEGG
jgi:hypothetical protein